MKYYDNFVSKDVFHFFEKISEVPHCSYDEQRISDYLVGFAKERDLEYHQDEHLNVIIKKNATAGYENAPAVILQGHMDMVCEKNAATVHDFSKDPIVHVVKEDMLYADGTTLGADNGIAVAMALALLDSSDVPHPRLECLFTVEEEVGLAGAQAIEADKLSGKYLINIDSEEEGTFLVSCAGGCGATLSLPIEWTILDGEFELCDLSITGLKGGHSGISIHEERGNSIKLLGRVLAELDKKINLEIQSIEGGSKDNAIPREAAAIVAIDKGRLGELKELLAELEKAFAAELHGKDHAPKLEAKLIESSKASVFNQATKKNTLALINAASSGVHTMSSGIAGLVESSKNLGVVRTSSDDFVVSFSVRSSVESLLFAQLSSLDALAELAGASVKVSGLYPGWEYNPESKLRELFVDTYCELYEQEPKIEAIHAGLECGILKKKLGDVDIISLGPDIFDPHSPDEHVRISSVENVYQFLLAVLKNFNKLS